MSQRERHLGGKIFQLLARPSSQIAALTCFAQLNERSRHVIEHVQERVSVSSIFTKLPIYLTQVKDVAIIDFYRRHWIMVRLCHFATVFFVAACNPKNNRELTVPH